jgi:negative regulator of replication initiation
VNRRQWRARLAAFATNVNSAWRRNPDRIPETPMWVLADQTAAGEVARKKTRWF